MHWKFRVCESRTMGLASLGIARPGWREEKARESYSAGGRAAHRSRHGSVAVWERAWSVAAWQNSSVAVQQQQQQQQHG